MRHARGVVPFVLLVTVGCLGGPPGSGPDAAALPPVIAAHDHLDAASHDLAAGLELVGFADARELLGAETARLSDIQIHGDLAAVAVNGRGGGSSGGFVLLDVSDPAQPRFVARYRSGSEDNWYTKFSADGRFVFLTANGNANATSAAGALREDAERGVATGAIRGIQVVDVSDPARPRLAAFHAFPVRVINLAVWPARDGTTILFASAYNDRFARADAAPAAPPAAANHVSVLRWTAAPPGLSEIAQWQPEGFGEGRDALPHDLAVAQHPVTGRDVLYVAYWDAGAFLVDVTDPARPVALGRFRPDPWSPGDHVHTVKPHPGLLGGRALAVAAAETFEGEPSGTYWLLDVADATAPVPLASWRLPPGDLANAEDLLFSPHEFTIADGRLYASNYHGGTWILELPSMRPVATWQRALGDAARSGDWAVDAETAVYHDGLVWVVDMGTGVIALRATV